MLFQTLQESLIGLAGGLCGLALVGATALPPAPVAQGRPHCGVYGDSIALGLMPYYPRCSASATIGLPPARIVSRVHDADVVLISAGSNPEGHALRSLFAIRAKVTGHVVWIVPQNERAALCVKLAAQPGDRLVTFEAGRDGIHPRSYSELARKVGTL